MNKVTLKNRRFKYNSSWFKILKASEIWGWLRRLFPHGRRMVNI